MLEDEKYAYSSSTALSLLRAKSWDAKAFRPSWLLGDSASELNLLRIDSLRVKASLAKHWPAARDFSDSFPKRISGYLKSRVWFGPVRVKPKL